MLPKREEFLHDVRRAVREAQKPRVTSDSELVNADVVSQAIQRSALWLTPRVVEAYDPSEFSSSPHEQQEALREAVEQFRATSAAVAPDSPATRERFRSGLEAFGRLTSVVRETVLSEWTSAVDEVVRRIESWCGEFGWRTKREPKALSETLLGEYTLPQLHLFADRHLFVLDPVARFVPGALGALDLSIQPSFYVRSIYRALDGAWYVHLHPATGVNGAAKRTLDKESFGQALEELRSAV